MLLSSGARLGPYEILSPLGAGGMGEVYKARDTRLERTVAIKILPDTLAADPHFRERFDREARAISQLEHPHICALYDVGEYCGTAFLVMQYLEGQTLQDRLAKGALPLDQALKTAIEIASGLDAAHRAGIVHRDLKPGNIVLTKGGAKLLDFGLAKTGIVPLSNPAVSDNVTAATELTTPGTILGTAQYMAPEQLEGKGTDARTDIFAFGAVLYEMVTGRKAFEASSPASLIAAILERDPPAISSVPPHASLTLDRIVETCLAKDPDNRWQTARDLVRELKWAADADSSAAPSGSSPRHRRIVVGVAALLVVVTGVALAIVSRVWHPQPQTGMAARFEIATPTTNEPMSFALSPDGRQLAFVANSDRASTLWIRALDRLTAQPIAGTENAIFPFWSPDSRTIAFFGAGKLKAVEASGGPPRVIADAPSGRGGSWNSDGVILFAPSTASVIMQVPAVGGSPTAVTRLAKGQSSHRWPQFLPDGRRFLYVAAQGVPAAQGLFVASLEGGEPRRVLEGENPPTYVPPGTLLVVRRGGIVALHFDPVRAAVTGDDVPVAPTVGWDATMIRGALTASATGVLAYRATLAVPRQLVWFDRTGANRGAVGPPDEGALAGPEISHDGRRAAVYRTVGSNTDVWLVELGRGVSSRFTFHEQIDFFPLWSADDQRVIFGSNRNGTYEFFEKSADGAGDEMPIVLKTFTSTAKLPHSVSADGRFLLYGIQVPQTGVDLWALPLGGDRKAFAVVESKFDDMAGQFSPDGRWVAYQSNESERVEVYVTPFPGPGGHTQISFEGGTQARWRPDGRELFYVAADSRLMAVPVGASADRRSLEVGKPVPLFPTRLATGMNVFPAVGTKAQYAVAPDGRFLMNVPVEGATAPPITVMLNWDAALKK